MLYLERLRVLQEKKVRYFPVGGLAMNLHGVPRTTMDVDIVVAVDVKNRDALLAAAKVLRLNPVEAFTLAARTPETAMRQERLRRGEQIVPDTD